jgi:hypothetical protein
MVLKLRRLWNRWRPSDSLFLLFLCVVSGLTQVLGIQESEAVTDIATVLVFTIWSYLLLLGSVVSITGLIMYKYNHRFKGLLIESAGRWMLAPVTLAYAFAVMYLSHNFLNVILLVGFSAACFGRIGEINDRIREWKALAHGGN